MSQQIVIQIAPADLQACAAICIGLSLVLVFRALDLGLIRKRRGAMVGSMWSGSVLAVCGASLMVVGAILQMQ